MRMVIGSLFCAALLVTGPVHAEDPTEEQICRSLGWLAGKIMEIRQTGASIPEIMSALPEGAMGNKPIMELVVRAFAVPLSEVDEDRVEAAQEFREQAYVDCPMMIAQWPRGSND